MPVPTAVVDRLIALGGRTGTLDPADLAAAVPLDHLSLVDLADLIDRLEDAGVAVEIDPRLLAARAPVPQDQILPPVANAGGPPRVGVFARPHVADGAVPAGSPRLPPPDRHHHPAGPSREISPTLLAIGSMMVAVVLILLVVGGGHAGG